jgi:DMSO/TMAO reductase YedYZ molybdopterin-dependent catalytic subunit/multisubunit Na+/H+ antiporter MnhG subunit
MRRSFLVGAGAGAVGIGIDQLLHGIFGLPLLPEQVGDGFLRLLPLKAFSALVDTLGGAARPLLLIGVTLGLLAAFGVAALSASRSRPAAAGPSLAVLGALLAVAAAASSSGSSTWPSVALEAVVLAAAVGATWFAAGRVAAPKEGIEDRRAFLRGAFGGIVALAVGGITISDVARLLGALGKPKGTLTTAPVTPVESFYVVSKNLAGDPVVDSQTWRLVLPDGRGLTYEELLALPTQTIQLTLECISNLVGGHLISNGIWRGPRLDRVLTGIPTPPGAKYLLMEAADGYTESLALADLPSDAMIASHLDGQPLTTIHGFPARILFPGRYGMKQPKWLTRLSYSATDRPGYWEQLGWDETATVKTNSRIDSPADGDTVGSGSLTVRGIAFAGIRRISAVELSVDRGVWREATLEPELSPYSWRFWHAEVKLASGQHGLRVRAIDGVGRTQSGHVVDPLPAGSEGLHEIGLQVA